MATPTSSDYVFQVDIRLHQAGPSWYDIKRWIQYRIPQGEVSQTHTDDPYYARFEFKHRYHAQQFVRSFSDLCERQR